MTPVQVYSINSETALGVASAMRLVADEVDAVLSAVAQSDPALAIYYNANPVAVCGFIPLSVLSFSAYAWMQWSPEIYEYPYATAKTWGEIFTKVLQQYNCIYGRCSYGQRPMRFLQRLGAKFHDDAAGVPCYVIEAKHEHAV